MLFKARLKENESYVFVNQFKRSVAGAAVPISMSTIDARFKQTQAQEPLFTTGQFCNHLVALVETMRLLQKVGRTLGFGYADS